MKRRKGFTLIELLVVIVIIGILAALLLVAIGAGIRMARRTQANYDVKSIAMALQSYFSEYHKWPPTMIPDPEHVPVKISGNIAKLLQGENVPATPLPGGNPRKMTFMQFKRLAGDDAAKPVNPWWKGSAEPSDDETYWFKLDNNFDNVIDGTGNPEGPPEMTIKRSVIVWTRNMDNNTFIMSSDERK